MSESGQNGRHVGRSAASPRVVVCAVIAVLIALVGHPATAAAGAFLRVISQRAPVHSGPGNEYRAIYYAERGDVFEVLERGTTGYWFKVELEDGTTGWIYGELVFPFERVKDDKAGFFTRTGRAIKRAILGPPPVVHSDVEISFSAGVLDGEGLFVFRPAWLIDRQVAVEGFAGLSPRKQKDVFLGGLGLTLRLAPGATIGPYVHAGVGAAHIRPKADNFTDPQETLMAVAAGAGFEITFKKQITLRLDFRNWTLFDPDQASNGQEFTSGLAIFF
ncbi:MAG: SH3 domain-containing protein [Proteobacteria bacterium]|nr:SH3 domain-containing protein [Pseudomonadota bacterium]